MIQEEDRIREILAEKLEIKEEELAEDIHLDNLFLDSLDILELVVAIEKEFDIRLDDERFMACETVHEVAELINIALKE